MPIASYGVLNGRVISIRLSTGSSPHYQIQPVDKQKAKMPLSGTFESGAVMRVDIVHPVVLSSKGGIISTLNSDGLKVDGVSYTREQANRPSWALVF